METKHWRDYDYLLAGCVTILVIFGTTMVYTATFNNGPLQVLFPRHIINLMVGLIGMVVFTIFDYRQLSGLARPLFIGIIALLLLVHLSGEVSSGAQSWINLGTRTIQPSEFAKIVMIIVLAAYWSRFEQDRDDLRVHLGSLLLMGVPMILVLLQPDFGTALVFAAIWLTMAVTAGLRWYYLLSLFVLAIPACYLGWWYVLEDYQRTRLSTFYWLLIDPSVVDRTDEAYNIIQSLNAISAGGVFGTGLGRGLMSQGSYIPVQYSDFIFAVVGEELGFVGSCALLFFLGLLLWATLNVAERTKNLFGRLIVVGIFGMSLCHILVNVGMNMSIMPVTGIPLPFISYGGSFTITMLVAVGLIESVAMRSERLSF